MINWVTNTFVSVILIWIINTSYTYTIEHFRKSIRFSNLVSNRHENRTTGTHLCVNINLNDDVVYVIQSINRRKRVYLFILNGRSFYNHINHGVPIYKTSYFNIFSCCYFYYRHFFPLAFYSITVSVSSYTLRTLPACVLNAENNFTNNYLQ